MFNLTVVFMLTPVCYLIFLRSAYEGQETDTNTEMENNFLVRKINNKNDAVTLVVQKHYF